MTMGWAGFDMDPQNPLTEANQLAWNQFLAMVRIKYKDDPKFVVLKGGLLFNTGWGPNLPFDVTKFISFANQVSSPALGATAATTRQKKSYVAEVFLLAYRFLDGRVKFWNSSDSKEERWGLHSIQDYHNVQLQALEKEPAPTLVNVHDLYFPPETPEETVVEVKVGPTSDIWNWDSCE